jgi:hypothetical protein
VKLILKKFFFLTQFFKEVLILVNFAFLINYKLNLAKKPQNPFLSLTINHAHNYIVDHVEKKKIRTEGLRCLEMILSSNYVCDRRISIRQSNTKANLQSESIYPLCLIYIYLVFLKKTVQKSHLH